MPIFGALRIKNEARWIERVIRSIQPACDEIFVLDDHSTDGTPDICESLGAKVERSEFDGLDESRDKDHLLQTLFEAIPAEDKHFACGNPECPYWALVIDGDEELVIDDVAELKRIVEVPGSASWSLRILYLWDAINQYRTDGVYGRFARPSLFRLMNQEFRYKRTPWGNGANFHCSSIPQELLGHSRASEVRLLHWGYIDSETRRRKYDWYNRIDPGNVAEDCYRHIIQGDSPEMPRSMRLKWAGPLAVSPLNLPQLEA